MKQLIEDYKRRLATAEEAIETTSNNGSQNDIAKMARLNAKASEYRTFIAELKRELMFSNFITELENELNETERKEKSITVRIEPHTTINKRFDITTEHLCLMVDFDDVNHPEVEAAVLQLKKIIEKNWNADLHEKLYKREVMKIWEKNEYGLQSDYEEGGLKAYLADLGINS